MFGVKVVFLLLALWNIFSLGISQSEEGFDNMDFGILPVGITLNNREVVSAALVYGYENGIDPVNFDDWLLPFEVVKEVLSLNVIPVVNDDSNNSIVDVVSKEDIVRIESAFVVTQFDLSELIKHPELGLTISMSQLKSLLGVNIFFDVQNYAVVFETPRITSKEKHFSLRDLPVVITGLPIIEPEVITFTNIEQKFETQTSEGNSLFKGETKAVGSLLNGPWYARLKKNNFLDPLDWQLQELQYTYLAENFDVALGSQNAFWQGDSFWGGGAVLRFGFTPNSLISANSLLSKRRQSSTFERTVEGKAEPGTLVRLVTSQGSSIEIIAETLVDSTGLFRFEDVPSRNSSRYELLLYLDGKLSQEPVKRDIYLINLPEQLPQDISSLTFALGAKHSLVADKVLGTFTDLVAGAAYRRGVDENLTFGVGAVYSQGLRGLGEIFYRPNNIPLQLSTTVLSPVLANETSGDNSVNWDLNSSLRYEPLHNLVVQGRASENFASLRLDYKVLGGFNFGGGIDSGDGLFTSVRYTNRLDGWYLSSNVSFTQNLNLRWDFSLDQQTWNASLRQTGNETSARTEFRYDIPKKSFLGEGHSLYLFYNLNYHNGFDQLKHNVQPTWQYRPPEKNLFGERLWEAELGYTIDFDDKPNNHLIAKFKTGIISGIFFEAGYRGNFDFTNDSYTLSLTGSFDLQEQFRAAKHHSSLLAIYGGILIRPFFDDNANTLFDKGERVYTENLDLLLAVNNVSLNPNRAVITETYALLNLPQGTYRLDLDPAGYPIGWHPEDTAYAVTVSPAAYTTVDIPLQRVYTLTGIITDSLANPVSGASVKALSESGDSYLSITNTAGVYYLEGLSRGSYTLLVDGNKAFPSKLIIDEQSEEFQELNLTFTQSKEPKAD